MNVARPRYALTEGVDSQVIAASHDGTNQLLWEGRIVRCQYSNNRLNYNTWKFDEKKFSGSKDEPNLDKRLFISDLLEHLVDLPRMRP